MSGSPSWLTTSAPAPAPAAAAPEPLSIEPTTQAAGTATETSDEDDLPRIILMMRLLNMGAATGLITVSILTIVRIPPLSSLVLAIYATCGGLLICCLETQLKFLRVMIAVNFGFLFNSMWRFLFYMILASVTYAYGGLLGFVMSCVMVGVAFFNAFILCRYPAYRKVREKIAEEEDKRIQDRIAKEVKTQAKKEMKKQVIGGN
mmetsp:Transcript_7944/g.19537  ORF Transcript_7944/g.19537 Transcript_7944/m.19537 type:complete len:204 (-) Transcript_7944:186-797(-)